MRTRSIGFVAATVFVLAATAACGSTAKTAPTPTPATLEVAGPNPSVSAKMICGEAKEDIAQQAVVVDTARPLAPKWSDHVYSCDYTYGSAVMTLSVKELADKAETDAYFASMATKLGKTENIKGLGQGAFTTKNLSAVVRKDYKVLLVDISKLPANFGTPPDSRADIALNVAATIMGCWTGA